MKKVIFPLSADPITFGHIHIIRLALKKFDFIYLLINSHQNKKYLLTQKERYLLTKMIIAQQENLKDKVKVFAYDELTAHFAIEKEVSFIIRGYRNSVDLEYEKSLNFYNQNIFPLLKTIYIKSQKKYKFVSSSAVKTLMDYQGEVYQYIPLFIKKFFEQKKNIYRLGVTGSIASGKTTFCKILAKEKINNLTIHHIDFDEIVSEIYKDIAEGNFPKAEEQILKICNHSIKKVSKENVSRFIFKNMRNEKKKKNKLLMLQKILSPLIKIYSFQKIKNKKGIILFDAPLLVEYNMTEIVNKEVILLSSKNQVKNLQLRDKLSFKQAEEKVRLVNTTEEKKILLEIKKCNFFVFENDELYNKNNLLKKAKLFLKEVIQKININLKI